MSNQPEVTVNVVASLDGLQKGLKDIPNVISNGTKGMTTPSIPLTTPKVVDKSKAKSTGIILPDYKDANIQMEALLAMNERLVTAYRKLEDSGNGGSEAALKLGAALDQIDERIDALMLGGWKDTKPLNRRGKDDVDTENVAAMELPSFDDDQKQLSALQAMSDKVAEIIEKYKAMGQSSSWAASVARDKFDEVLDAMDALEAKMAAGAEAGGGGGKKPPKTPKPPPLPEPEPEGDPLVNKLAGMGQISQQIGKISQVFNGGAGAGGRFGAMMSRLGSILTKLPPQVLAIAAAVVALIAVVVVIVVAIKQFADIMVSAIAAADAYERKLIALAGSLGTLKDAQIAMNNVDVAIESAGVDKESVRALIPMLEAKTRGALNSEGGLDLIVDAAARIDPKRVGEFGNAIADAYATLRTGGSAAEFSNELIQLGLISGDTGRELEMMSKRGASQQQVWAALVSGIRKAGEGAKDANNTLSGAWNRITTSIRNAWSKAMEVIGGKFTQVVGPALTRLAGSIEAVLPSLSGAATMAGDLLGKVADWVADVIDGVAFGVRAIAGLAQNGKIGEALGMALELGFLMAANALVNNLAIGMQMVADMLLMPIKAIMNGNLWSALGNTLLALADLFLAAMGGLTGVMVVAASAMLKYLLAGLDYAKDSLTPGGDANFGRSLKEAGNNGAVKMIGNFGSDILSGAGKDAKSGLANAGAALGDAFNLSMEESPIAKLVRGEYDTPDILGDSIDANKQKLMELMAANALPEKQRAEDNAEEDIIPPLKDVVGQAGPKAVADSLQSVGGGGMSFGISWQDRMLEETKTQNVNLSTIAENTASADGAFSTGSGEQSLSVILTTISTQVQGILDIMRSSGGATTSGVTRRA